MNGRRADDRAPAAARAADGRGAEDQTAAGLAREAHRAPQGEARRPTRPHPCHRAHRRPPEARADAPRRRRGRRQPLRARGRALPVPRGRRAPLSRVARRGFRRARARRGRRARARGAAVGDAGGDHGRLRPRAAPRRRGLVDRRHGGAGKRLRQVLRALRAEAAEQIPAQVRGLEPRRGLAGRRHREMLAAVLRGAVARRQRLRLLLPVPAHLVRRRRRRRRARRGAGRRREVRAVGRRAAPRPAKSRLGVAQARPQSRGLGPLRPRAALGRPLRRRDAAPLRREGELPRADLRKEARPALPAVPELRPLPVPAVAHARQLRHARPRGAGRLRRVPGPPKRAGRDGDARGGRRAPHPRGLLALRAAARPRRGPASRARDDVREPSNTTNGRHRRAA